MGSWLIQKRIKMAKWKWLTSSNDSFNVDENGNEIFE